MPDTTFLNPESGSPRKTAADWVREMRMSADVNKTTVGVDTDRVTPDLLLATSNKLLKINKREAEPDSKDSLQFQRIYSAPDFVAEHILRDAGRVGRQLLWKATNRGNVDFIPTGALDQHVSDVFNTSKMANMIDGSSPLEVTEATYKVTRIGEGGLSSQDSAPVEMRLVQPSFLGYIDPVSTPECYASDTELYTKSGWKVVTEIGMDDELACLVDGRLEYHRPECINVYPYDGTMYGYRCSKGVSYLVTGNHRMWSRCADKTRNGQVCKYRIKTAEEVHSTERRVRTGGHLPVLCNESQRTFRLPKVAPEVKREPLPGAPPVGSFLNNVDELDIDDFAELLGWYLAEGNYVVDRNRPDYRISISQNKGMHEGNWERINKLVARLGFNATNLYSYKNGDRTVVGVSVARKQLALYMEQFGKSNDKFIPDWVFDAPVSARVRLRDAMLAGDGRGGRHLCTKSKRLALDFERLQFGLGETVCVTHEPENRYAGHPGIWVVYWALKDEFGLSGRNRGSNNGYFVQHYSGKVYCPTVPGGLVFCRREGHRGFWCGNSFRVGLDGVFTKHCMKGTDGKLYQKFINARTGKEELVDSVTASKSVVTTPDMMSANTDHIFALGGKTGARIVNKSDVDYYLPRMDDAFSNAVNAVTGISGVKELRLRMGCLHPMTTMLTVDKENRVHIMHAKSVNKSSGRLPVISNVGGTTYQPIRGTYSKFPQNRAWFRKVVLYSGRVLITSRDHRWSVLRKGGSIDLVNAEKLKPGDKVMRTLFKDIPGRRTFINGVLINKPVAVLLGYAVRTLSNPDDDKLTITYQRRHEKTIVEAIKRIGAEDEVKFYVTARKLTLSTSKGWFHDWLAENIGADELRCVPSEILSANLDIVAMFLDAYTADETQIAEDSGEDLWILNLPNTTARDGIAYLLARTGTDTYYRDAYLGNGKTELALKLSTPGRLQGDCVVDEIKSVLPAPNSAIMVDIDVDDQLYATANGIVTHNSKYPQQAVSLIDREAPLVRGLDEQSGKDMSTLFGKYLGARYAPKAGTVSAVRKDRIDMVYDDGTKGSVALYNNYPMNSKGFIDNTPTVKAGMHVDKNGLLASSNYTNDKGEAALGTNLRVGWISWRGGTYEDAIVISESTAKKLTSNTMYAKALDLDKTVTLGKSNYLAWKPGEYTKEQLSALDNEGIIKPGSVIRKGDPLVLAVRTSEPSPGTMGKRVLTDISETWEHDHPGTVTDVVRTKNGVKVLAIVTAPAEVGDKLSNNYGAKGVISKVLPDDEMPKDKDGKPLEVLMAPLGLVSRCYDEETEFLTKDGWKFGKDMLDSDLLYCYNRDTDTWMWGEQLSAFWRAPFDGYMFSFSNDTADFCVTPGHRVWSAPDCPGSSYVECHIEDIYGKTCYIPAVARRRHKAVESTQFELPVTDEEHMTFPAGDWTEFLGWYTLQGTTTYDTATDEYFVQLKHPDTDPATIHRRASLLSRLHLAYSYEKDSLSFFIHDKKLAEYTKGLGEGRNKKLPAWLMQQPDDILITFLNIMQEGTTPGNTRDILLLSENIADQLQQMLCMLGIVSVKSTTDAGSYKLSIDTTGKCEHLLKDKWEKTAYKGMTYCPTVATGYILTRRHGKCACMGNTNPMQLDETLLGKIAHKTGKPEVIPAFYNGDRHQYVLDRLKQNRLNADDDFFDPETGRRIPNVVNGYSYIYKLKHMSESKESGRGTDEYSADDTPGGHGYAGSKRFGNLEVAALVGHGAFDTLLDAKLIRGQANSDFWRSLRTGEIPTIPGEPLVQRKFFSHLQGAGVNVRKTPKGISVFALSNSDVSSLAGPREVKSRDTYEAKNFRPIDGGLFGQDIFGINGDKWGYIKLDEPLPNPVMAAPLAKLLRMSDKDFVDVASGQKEVDGMSNSTQLKDRLEHIDLAQESKTALKEFKEAPASKKDATLKRYVAVERMRRAGLNPSEYMLDKIPVLPPIFRPVSSHGGLTMVADANYLYAQLLDARDDLRESRDLPQEYQDKARANIYNKWQELTGLYDPEDVKLKNKNVGGLLQWALGKGSPKFSAAQRKVVGMSVDTVGRGAIVPDSRLTIDEVGIPVSMAFSVMAPFVERKLVQRGYTPIAAMKMVKNQDKQALDVLQEVVDTHPVEMNRAPSLHKFNIMAFKPRLVRGHAVHVNPSVCPGFNADFDGDSMLNLTRIAVDTQAIKNKVEKTGKNNLTSLESGVYSVWCQNGGTDNTGEHKMISNNTKCAFATVTAPLSSLPVVEGSAVAKSDTVTEWDVQGGFYTDTVDPATGKHELAQITKVSKHTGLRMFDCTLSMRGSYKHIATVSEDHSLITIDPKTLELTKTRPEDAEGRLVPVVRGSKGNDWDKCAKYITMGIELPSSYALGLFIGIMLGDGWVNCQNLAFIACCDKSLQRFILDLVNGGDTHIPQRKPAALQVYGPLEDRFSDKDRARIALYIDWKVSKALHDLIGDGAYNKRIPDDCMMASRAHLIGILMGLLATDGSVSYAAGTKAKKKAAKTITINTTSCLLKDGIQELCRRLGIRTGATPYRGIHSKVDCYAVTLSIVDVAAAAKKNPALFRIPMQSKQEALEKIILEVENSPAPQETDIVPFPSSMRGEFVTVGANTKFLTYYNNAITKGYIGRKVALKIAKDMEDHDWTSFTEPRSVYAKHRSNRTPEEAEAVVNKWISTVRDTDIAWEHVDSVVPSSCTEGWDCTVPGPYTFVLSTGTVVQDTVNIHVPVSDNARKEALEKMLPSRNLTTLSNHKIMNKPEKEYLQGLYIATRLGKQSPGGTRKFNSLEEARDAYRRGEIDVDTPIDLV